MRVVFLFLISILVITGSVSRGRAAGSVNMTATVLERKSTDTINDFVWKGISNEPKVPLKNVLGVSTVNQDLVNNSKLTTQHLNYLFFLISPIYSLYYLITIID